MLPYLASRRGVYSARLCLLATHNGTEKTGSLFGHCRGRWGESARLAVDIRPNPIHN